MCAQICFWNSENMFNDTHRENFVILNSVQEFIEIEA